MNWTPELIESIVQNIQEKNIVPIIGPNVFYVKESGRRISVQEAAVRELLRLQFPSETVKEEQFQTFTSGMKGMTQLSKFFKHKGKTLKNYLNKLFKPDSPFFARISMDPDVLDFLQNGQFPLILCTCNFRFLDQRLKYHKQSYSVVSYQKEKVKNNPERDILLKEDKHGIERPAIFHLMGTLSAIPDTCVVTEDDFLIFLHCLQDTNTRPQNLWDFLRRENNKYILVLGSDIPDWTFRFLLYSLKASNGALIDNNGQPDNFVGGAVDNALDADIAEFLTDINYFSSQQLNAFLQDINLQLHPEAKPRIFLSVASDEYEGVGRQLFTLLSQRFDVWFFPEHGDPYAYWQSIEEGLQSARWVIPVITEKALRRIRKFKPVPLEQQSNNVQPGLVEEWERAQKLQKPCCPLYVNVTYDELNDDLLHNEACRQQLWSFFFPNSGAAGKAVNENFTAEALLHHLNANA